MSRGVSGKSRSRLGRIPKDEWQVCDVTCRQEPHPNVTGEKNPKDLREVAQLDTVAYELFRGSFRMFTERGFRARSSGRCSSTTSCVFFSRLHQCEEGNAETKFEVEPWHQALRFRSSKISFRRKVTSGSMRPRLAGKCLARS